MINYPCYFLFGDEGGFITNTVGGHDCLCLFTSYEAVGLFTAADYESKHGTSRDEWKAPVDEVTNAAGLLDRLLKGEASLAGAGINYISFNPLPGKPSAYATIRDIILDLQGEISKYN